MKLTRKRSVLTAVLFVCVFILFMAPAAFSAETIKVGVVVPLTGSFADEGTEMVRGVELMVEEVNAEGGLLGKQLEMIIGDIGTFSGEKIVSVGEKLVNRDKVDVIITQYLGGVVDIKTFGEFDIPYMNMDTSSLAATAIRENLPKYSNIFQSCPPETFYGKGTFDFISRIFPKQTGYQYPNKKIALITMVRGYNDRISANFREVVKNSGEWEIVVDEKTPAGTVEWRATLTKIRQAEPSVIYFNDHVTQDEVAFLKQFHTNPTNSLIFMQYGPSNPAFIDLGKNKTNDIFWGTVYAGFGPKTEAWKKRYLAKYDEQPGVGTAIGTYTSAMIWAGAVKKTGDEKNYAEVCRNIREFSHNISGPTHVYNPDDQTGILGEGLLPYMVYQIQDMEQQLVSPARFSTSPIKMPAWMK